MASYCNALVGGLDAPEVVVDAFHIVRLGNTIVDEIRRRVQHDPRPPRPQGRPALRHPPAAADRRERLSPRGPQRIRAGLAAGDHDDEVWYAWSVKEQLRAVYRAGDETTAREALADFYDLATAAAIPECDGCGAPSSGGTTPCWPTSAATGSQRPTEAI